MQVAFPCVWDKTPVGHAIMTFSVPVSLIRGHRVFIAYMGLHSLAADANVPCSAVGVMLVLDAAI